MATSAAAAILTAALGAFGPRAQFFALRQEGAEPVARAVAARIGEARAERGLGAIPVLEDLLGLGQLASAIAPNLPMIEAASGMKSAQEFVARQAVLRERELAVQQTAAEGAAAQARIGAWAPWVALGVGAIGLSVALSVAASRKFAGRAA